MRQRICFAGILAVVFVLGCSSEPPIEPVRNEKDALRVAEPDVSAPDLYELEGRMINLDELAKLPDRGLSVLATGAIHTVELPDGSVDGLAAAIDAAGPRGIVIVKAGLHTESGTVTITKRARILGEPGAILEVDTKPTTVAPIVDPALHILNVDRVIISGLEIRPRDAIGGTGILVENANKTLIRDNKFSDHQFSVMVERGDGSRILDNLVSATPAWQTTFFEVYGIVIINGKKVRIKRNDISNSIFGAWICDQNGSFWDNEVHANLIGVILCKVPPNSFPLPGGNVVGSDFSAENWWVTNNNATGNFDVGYLVIDGANNNRLTNNAASANTRVDMELAGDSMRFGFLTPGSFENNVRAGSHSNISIKDCGVDNRIVGGALVDNTADPCF